MSNKEEMRLNTFTKRGVSLLLILCLMGMLSGCELINHTKKGLTLLESGDIDAAKGQFQTAIDRNSNAGEASFGMGICFYEEEEYEEAVKWFSTALDKEVEKSAVLYNMLGVSLLKIDKPEKASYYFEEGQAFADATPEQIAEMSYNLVTCYEMIGEYGLASEKLEEYVAAHPEDTAAKRELEFLHTQTHSSQVRAESSEE